MATIEQDENDFLKWDIYLQIHSVQFPAYRLFFSEKFELNLIFGTPATPLQLRATLLLSLGRPHPLSHLLRESFTTVTIVTGLPAPTLAPTLTYSL